MVTLISPLIIFFTCLVWGGSKRGCLCNQHIFVLFYTSMSKDAMNIEVYSLSTIGLDWTILDNVIGSNLKRLREAKRLSMDKLAEKSGITTQSIYRIENGKQVNVSTDTIKALSIGLGCKPYELTGDEPDKPTTSKILDFLTRELSKVNELESQLKQLDELGELTEKELILLEHFRKNGPLMQPLVLFLLSKDQKFAQEMRDVVLNSKSQLKTFQEIQSLMQTLRI